MKKLVWITTSLLVAACGDDNPGTPDAPVAIDSPDIDAAIDAPPTPYTPPTPFSFHLSADGQDQMPSAYAGPGATFYTAGFVATAAAPNDRFVVVTRLTATGPDTTFGTQGVVTTTLRTTGTADEVDIATQSDGKIIVSATTRAAVPNALDNGDTDIALIRLLPTGAVDTTFGTAGTTVVSLSTSIQDTTVTPPAFRRDGVRALAIGAGDLIYVHAYQRGDGVITGTTDPRIDTDFVVARFTAAGALDTTYGTGGKFVYDIFVSNTHTQATVRGLAVNTDGSVIAGGYASTPAVGNTTQAVLYKVNPAGTALDTTFATAGLFHEVVLATQTEIYNFARHGDNLVTGGYGRSTGTTNDFISLRFNANTGVRDTTWGPASGGVLFDPSGTMLGSNCRNAVALPGGKTLLIGSTGPSNAVTQDAVFAVLTATGQLDTTFGTGIVKYGLGMNGNDQFWGAAVNGNTALIVGYQGSQTNPPSDDDSYGVILTLP